MQAKVHKMFKQHSANLDPRVLGNIYTWFGCSDLQMVLASWLHTVEVDGKIEKMASAVTSVPALPQQTVQERTKIIYIKKTFL